MIPKIAKAIPTITINFSFNSITPLTEILMCLSITFLDVLTMKGSSLLQLKKQ